MEYSAVTRITLGTKNPAWETHHFMTAYFGQGNKIQNNCIQDIQLTYKISKKSFAGCK